MRRGTPWFALGVVLALTTAAVLWQRGRDGAPRPLQPSPLLHPVRPEVPLVEGQGEPAPPPEPQPPPNQKQIFTEAYAKAIEAGDERPGGAAFRATVDAFVAHNKAFAEAQAAEEGITVAEVADFTFFGFLVLQSQHWPEIEHLTGQPLSDEVRERAGKLMHDVNAAFKTALRKLVAEGAPEAARRRLFAETQQRYQREYFALTGMNEELLDDLLAGDPSRPGAPSSTPIPPPTQPPTRPEPIPPRPESVPGQD